MRIITLTTDFGTRDWFVGAMKGAILARCPGATVVDMTHEIPAGDIRAGAFALTAACRYFPKGTVHVAVVDPGVGSARGAIAVRTANYHFVGPDNGVLSFALRHETRKEIRRLENERYFVRPASNTFHGRDIFAPVAARLAGGLPMNKLGPAQKEFVRLTWPEPRTMGQGIRGEVVYVDRFGNLITNIAAKLASDGTIWIEAGRRRIPFATHYHEVARGEALALAGSAGLVEISINGDSAAKKLRMKIGSAVKVVRK